MPSYVIKTPYAYLVLLNINLIILTEMTVCSSVFVRLCQYYHDCLRYYNLGGMADRVDRIEQGTRISKLTS